MLTEPIFNETCDQRRAICGCGRFLAHVVATIRSEAIAAVHGTCSRHGRVEAYISGGWCWEDFFGEE